MNEHMAVEHLVVADRDNRQGLFFRQAAMAPHPGAGGVACCGEAAMTGVELRIAHRQEFSAATIEEGVGIQALDPISAGIARQAECVQGIGVAEGVFGEGSVFGFWGVHPAI